MNIGVQTRKLFEPEKYPLSLRNGTTASNSIIRQARHARSSFLDAFTTELGEDRSRNTCVFGFEANPFHTARLQALQSCYVSRGWRVAIFTETAVNDANGTRTFFGDPTGATSGNRVQWAASLQPHGRSAGKMPRYNVTSVDLARWIEAHVVPRRLPAADASGGTQAARVLLKMDVESTEFVILPRMLALGLLCSRAISWLNLEWHIGFLARACSLCHARRNCTLVPVCDAAQTFMDGLPAAMRQQSCKPTRTVTVDDDSYTNDSPMGQQSLAQCKPGGASGRRLAAAANGARPHAEQDKALRRREANSLLAAGLLLPDEHAVVMSRAADPSFTYRSVAWIRQSEAGSSLTDRLALLRRYLQLVYREQQLPAALQSDHAVREVFWSLGWLWNAAPVWLRCVHQFTSFPLKGMCTDQATSAVRGLSRGLGTIWEAGFLTPPRHCCAARELPKGVTLPPTIDRRGFHPDNAWIEVIRTGSAHFMRGNRKTPKGSRLLGREGGANGAWFLVASGTGVFINTGRSLRVADRKELVAALGVNVSTLPMVGERVGDLQPASAIDLIEDYVALCPLARARGYASIQVGNPDIVGKAGYTRPCTAKYAHAYPHEFVCCHDECMTQLDPKSPCVGPSALRTGYNASLPCDCDPTQPVLNCHRTAAEKLPWPWTRPYELFNKRSKPPYCQRSLETYSIPTP